MEFFLEMVLTAVVALLFSFVVAKLVSVDAAGGGNGSSSEPEGKSGIHVGEDDGVEDLRFGRKMEARVLGSERSVGVVEENVEHVDRFVGEAVRVGELDDAATGSGEIGPEREVSAVRASEAESAAAFSPENVVAEEILVRGQVDGEAEFGADVSLENVKAEDAIVPGQEVRKSETDAAVLPEDVKAEEMVVRGEEERKFEIGTAVSPENVIAEEIGVGGEEELESESGDSVSPENVVAEEAIVRGQEKGSELLEERCDRVEIEESGDVAVDEAEEVRVEESESKEGIQEKTEELNIEEEDDDWEGIEKSELEKAFAAAAKFVEESGDVLEIGNEAKTELYGLHKIATEGPCRDSPPMALMLSARAKWYHPSPCLHSNRFFCN